METIFDFLSVMLFIAAVSLFFVRFRNEDPPLKPYILISLIAAVGNWLGNNDGGIAAFSLLIAGAFFLLHLASEPFRGEDTIDGSRAPGL